VTSLATKDVFAFVRPRSRVFVETGSYRGETIEWARHRFDRVYSIELSPEFHAECRRRFAEAPNVVLIQDDSVRALERLLPEIGDQCVLWLDAHYSSKGTARGAQAVPLLDELAVIGRQRRRDHVILIDDVRLFGSSDPTGLVDWTGVTMPRVRGALGAINPRYRVFEYEDTLVGALDQDLVSFHRLRRTARRVAQGVAWRLARRFRGERS
jgi:hypothetical protein